MLRLLRRVLASLGVLWVAATLAFFALSILPGDAIESQLTRSGADPALIAERRASLGLTDPVGVRYLRFLGQAIQGDLGVSLLNGEPVIAAVLRNLGPTFSLALGALITATLTGIGLGVLGALEVPIGSRVARLLIGLALSVPIYWTGTLAIYLFTVQLAWLPSAGAGRWSQLILPVLVLGFHTAGAIARVMQASMREALTSDFVRTAQAKGLHRRRIIGHHTFRVAVIPVVSIIVLQAGFLFSGTVITESLFVRPGIGRLLLDAVLQQDYPIVLGVVCLSTCAYLLLSLVGDLLLHVLDPRVIR